MGAFNLLTYLTSYLQLFLLSAKMVDDVLLVIEELCTFDQFTDNYFSGSLSSKFVMN